MAEVSTHPVPELLTEDDMHRFMTDVDFREARRAARLDALPPPGINGELRGYTREWLFTEDEPIPEPQPFDDALAEALQTKIARLKRPFMDDITEGYNLGLVYEKTIRSYIEKRTAVYLGATALEEHPPEHRQAFNQAAKRMKMHITDIFLRNLWINTTLAEERLAYLSSFNRDLKAGQVPDSKVLAAVAHAVADLGYCMRYEVEHPPEDTLKSPNDNGPELHASELRVAPGLLAKLRHDLGVDTSGIPAHIEHVGLYVAQGHPEFLAQNPGLLELTIQQQQVRKVYWGSRYQAVQQTTGEQLSSVDQAATTRSRALVQELYRGSQESESTEA